MRMLILEDAYERVKEFFILFGDNNDLIIVNNAKDAISLVTTSRFDIIFLDHDLGGKVYVDSDCENTGYQVAKILSDSINKNTKIIIHSWNGMGVAKMKSVLSEHGGKVIDKHFGSFGKEILFS